MFEFLICLLSSLASAAKRGTGVLECGVCGTLANENRIRISSHVGKAVMLWKSQHGFYEGVLLYQPQSYLSGQQVILFI